MPLKPHADLLHLRKVKLPPETKAAALHPTWLQLAGAGYRVDDIAHLASAALRMGCTAQEAKRHLGRAYSVLGHPDRRVAKAFDVACETVQVRRHNVRVPAKGTRPQRFTTEFQNGHKLGLMEPPTSAEYRQMGREKVIDEGDSLRRRMLEDEAKKNRPTSDPNWYLLPKSAMRDVAADRSLAMPMIVRSGDDGEMIGLQEAA